MKDFDYVQAWTVLARPAFDALPQAVQDLYTQVAEEACNVAQDSETLDLPWPDIPGREGCLKKAFEALDNATLAHAARVIYSYGHWSPVPKYSSFGAGAYWRFSNYADQVLSERLGFARQRLKTPNGISWAVHEGGLRVQLSWKDGWKSTEVGIATTPVSDAMAGRFGWPLKMKADDYAYGLFDKQASAARTAGLALSGATAPFFDLETFMVEGKIR